MEGCDSVSDQCYIGGAVFRIFKGGLSKELSLYIMYRQNYVTKGKVSLTMWR